MVLSLNEVRLATEKLFAIYFQTGVTNVTAVSNVPSNVARYYANMAALRADAAPGTDGTPVELLGYYNAKDTSLPPYYWDNAATDADDGVFFIRPNSVGAGNPGRYRPRYNGAVRASWAGVLGGAANAAADTAILLALSNLVGEIILDRPEIQLTQRLDSTCKFTGEIGGNEKVKLRPAAGMNARGLIRFTDGAENVGCVGLDIDTLGFVSTVASRFVDPIELTPNVKGLQIEECRIACTGSETDFSARSRGVFIQDDGLEDVRIERCLLENLGSAIYLRGDVTNTTIRDCTIRKYLDHAFFAVADVGFPKDVSLINNVIKENVEESSGIRYPIEFGASNTNRTEDVTIIGNKIYGIQGQSHAQDAGTGSADQISLHHVDRCLVKENLSIDGGGMGLTCTINSRNVTIEGNLAYRCNASGYFIGNGARYVHLIGNKAIDCMNNYAGLVTDPNNYGGFTIRSTSGSSATRHIYLAENQSGNSDNLATQSYGIAAQESEIFNLKIGHNHYFNNAVADIRIF